MEQAIAGPACVVELPLEIGRMNFGDDAAGVGMQPGVADDCIGCSGPFDAAHRCVETLRVLRMSDPRIVTMED